MKYFSTKTNKNNWVKFIAIALIALFFHPSQSQALPIDNFSYLFYTINNSSYFSKTISKTAGVMSLPLTNNTALYIGSANKFNTVNLNLTDIYSTGLNFRLEYWNGNEWKKIEAITDNTQNLKQTGNISFINSVDWSTRNINNSKFYWVRLLPTSISNNILKVCTSKDCASKIIVNPVINVDTPFSDE